MRLVCVVLALLVPATAQAHYSLTSRTHNDRHVVQYLFGDVCDVGTMHVPIRRAELGRSPYVAFGRFLGYAYATGDVPPFTQCRIEILKGAAISDEDLCRLLVHEFLHLEGWRAVGPDRPYIAADGSVDDHHSGDQWHIMYPVGLAPFPPCFAANVRRVAQSYP